ncbi:lipase LipB [Legionella gratiana]|uniref:Lipase LipB n=1 Tax=Legionella gratiana TaxID=45066 RepID=A0A378JLQ7_9GAMM|nr:alpha/beta fold hydrolase [Legionella gratiana]KTD09116.1 lipase LipB [Legionella gratiana]STX45670.1 lipase LipB [Legionella gratiana]
MVKTIHQVKRSIQLILMISGMMCMVQTHAFTAAKQDPSASHKVLVQSQHAREIIVLVHGLMRTSLSMWPLKNFLKRKGYEVYSYNYPSPKYSIQEHGVYLSQFIKNLLAKNPGVKINFITHSLGGIITREALATLSKKQLKNIGSLIMLAPPNQGSKLAKLSTKMFPFLTFPIKPLAELSSDQTSYVHHVPVPNIKIGIIAGQYDAKVPPEYARLEGQNDPVIVNSNHTFIMNNAKTRELIMNFLARGTFNQEVGKLYSYNDI